MREVALLFRTVPEKRNVVEWWQYIIFIMIILNQRIIVKDLRVYVLGWPKSSFISFFFFPVSWL